MTIVQLSKRLNPLVSAILGSRLHWLLSPGLMLVTVTGRRTGRRYTIPVGYHQMSDAVVVMVAEAATKVWWRNYRRPGPIELRLRNGRLRGTAEVVRADSDEFRHRADASFRRSGMIARLFGIAFDPRLGLTDAQVTDLARQAAIVRITIAAA